MRVVSSTLAGESIAQAVQALYPLGRVSACQLARRGFNHVYEFTVEGGQRYVARLSSSRPRGEPNIAFETALLCHLKALGAAVAEPVLANDAKAWSELTVAEGVRTLAVFRFLDGDLPGESLPDVEAMGVGLAQVHTLSQSYTGPASRYRLDTAHLLLRPLAALRTAPGLDDAMRVDLAALGERLEKRVSALGPLTMVTCHGDCHGGNSFVTDGLGNTRLASFFDFDDAGPGYLAYDLAVYLWGMQMDSGDAIGPAKNAQWQHFLRGYRQVNPITDRDFEAIAVFVPIRHIWLLGERASRVHEWGTQALPASWLRKQLSWLAAWESLPTPAVVLD